MNLCMKYVKIQLIITRQIIIIVQVSPRRGAMSEDPSYHGSSFYIKNLIFIQLQTNLPFIYKALKFCRYVKQTAKEVLTEPTQKYKSENLKNKELQKKISKPYFSASVSLTIKDAHGQLQTKT